MERFRFVKQFGQGKFGQVWLIKCSNNKKKYVLKQIDFHRASYNEQKAAYLEVKLLSTLKHPNIVSYVDSFYCSNGSLFIIMNYCEGGDLYTCIRNRNGIFFEEKQIVNWLVQICMALKYLHDKNILHRDLKTKNIFLTRTKLVKIGDFGIARVLNNSKDMATTLIGTPYYMSPEVLCNKPYNYKSDIWAMGCCIYEVATLKHAFNAQDFNTLVQKILYGKMSGMPRIYSEEFLGILFSMLAHEPEQRPTASDILLNIYIRKHIVMFLKETQNCVRVSPKENVNCCSKECNNEDAIMSRQAVQGINTHSTLHNVQEPLITISNLNTKSSFSSKVKPTAVPDINGNGDGNGNSQQRNSDKNNKLGDIQLPVIHNCTERSSSESKSLTVVSPISCDSKLDIKNNYMNYKENIKSNFFVNCNQKSHCRPQENSRNCQSEPINQSNRKVNNAEKSGEMNLNFLCAITDAVRKSRAAYFHNLDKDLWQPEHAKDVLHIANSHSHPKSYEISMQQSDLSARFRRREKKQISYFFRYSVQDRTFTKDIIEYPSLNSPISSSSSCSSVSVYKSKKYSSVSPLSNSSYENSIVLPEVTELLFPFLKENKENAVHTNLKVDKQLLQQIINLNDGVCPINSIARQRRRRRNKAEQDSKHSIYTETVNSYCSC